MSALDDLLDRAVTGFVHRVPGWVVMAVAILFYPCLGLLLPVAFNWSLTALVSANVIGVSGAAVLSLGWLGAVVEQAQRRQLVQWTTDLRLLDSAEFEWLVGETFRRDGWKVSETGRRDSPDGNIDLDLTKDGQRKIVQCKRWTSWLVDVDEIRAFGGTLLREQLSGSSGIFVTLSKFTEAARSEARQTHLTLIDGPELYARVEKVRRPELCDICHKPMLLDHSQRGWWFRCTSAGCQGKRDLGSEPRRAVELLTDAPTSGSRTSS